MSKLNTVKRMVAAATISMASLAGLAGMAQPAAAADPIQLSVGDASNFEWNPGSNAYVMFPVTLSRASAADVQVAAFTYGANEDPSATALRDNDFEAKPVVSIPAGSTYGFIGVHLKPDTTPENNETFRMIVKDASAPEGVQIVDGDAWGTIKNDDTTITVHDAGASEGAGGYAVLVTLSKPIDSVVKVEYQTSPGSATAADFGAASGWLSFARNSTTAVISGPIYNDTQREGAETFSVSLSNPTAGLDSSGSGLLGTATIADGSAVFVIVDND